ncbi:hypothetical protein LCL61_10325 [Amycolatopsis coloradensis]|uniref:Uncharacterized protein n=1 Tax=Amycolatopsis coloradensis TaxID=76021 RepID=A0ACD5B9M6_9PSEU
MRLLKTLLREARRLQKTLLLRETRLRLPPRILPSRGDGAILAPFPADQHRRPQAGQRHPDPGHPEPVVAERLGPGLGGGLHLVVSVLVDGAATLGAFADVAGAHDPATAFDDIRILTGEQQGDDQETDTDDQNENPALHVLHILPSV